MNRGWMLTGKTGIRPTWNGKFVLVVEEEPIYGPGNRPPAGVKKRQWRDANWADLCSINDMEDER